MRGRQKPPLGERWFYRTLLAATLHAQLLRDQFLVEADDRFAVDDDNRDAELTGERNHFLTLGDIRRDIIFGVRELFFIKKGFCHMAKMARRRAVDDDGWCHMMRYNLRVMRDTVYHTRVAMRI